MAEPCFGSNIYNSLRPPLSSNLSSFDGPIPLPPITLDRFITQDGTQSTATGPPAKQPWQPHSGDHTHAVSETRASKPTQSRNRRGKTPRPDTDINALYDVFCRLDPGSEEASDFIKDLPEKLADLGEAEGSSNNLSNDSFLFKAWRYAWCSGLSKPFTKLCNCPLLPYMISTASVRKTEGAARAIVALSKLASFMLQSAHYYRFRIIGWPPTFDYPDSVTAMDFAPKNLQRSKKDTIRKWDSYRLIYAMYVGTAVKNSRYLLRFEAFDGSGEIPFVL